MSPTYPESMSGHQLLVMRLNGQGFEDSKKNFTFFKNLKKSTIPRGTAELIYKHYYADFVLFGYSPEEVLGFIEAANASATPPAQELNRRSRKLLKPLVEDDLTQNQDFICNEADSAELYYEIKV